VQKNGSNITTGSNVTFDSILTSITDGAASHSLLHEGSSEGVTEKELRLSHARMSEGLRERLLSIANRLRDLTLLEACHPAGASHALHFSASSHCYRHHRCPGRRSHWHA
jgi:hypothetical protein